MKISRRFVLLAGACALPLLAPGVDDVFWVVAGDIFAPGFVIYAVFAAGVLGCLALWQRRWVGTWVGPRGKVLAKEPAEAVPMRPATA